jgi:hypothetical protein
VRTLAGALCAALLAAAPAAALAGAPAGAPRAQEPAVDDPDLAAARIAWRYFERNTHRATGLVSSVEGHASTSAWDLGSSILAVLAARELGLVSDEELLARLGAILRTLETAPLFAGELPNKAYDAAAARMTDYANAPAPDGIGFSAVDLGRLVTALALAGDLHPPLRGGIERALSRWKTCRLVRGGELYGVHRDGRGTLRHLQEGRLGYEQYAAKGLALLGLDTGRARSYERHLAELPVLGVPVPHDARDRARFGAVDALVTEPWALGALELGLDPAAVPLARRVFEVQKRRFAATGVVTARSEDHVDRPPWFVYGAIVAGGAPWRTVDPEGKEVPGLGAVSTKAAFALAALHPDDPYASVLRRAVEGARDPERGWFAGVHEGGGPIRALTANTNAVVLEAILFRRRGPLHAACGACDGRAEWRARLAALAARNGPCPREDLGAGGSAAPALAAGSSARIPGPGTAPPGSAAPPRADEGARVDGAFFLTYRSDGPGAGGIATIWPWRAAFLRIGAEATPRSLQVGPETTAPDRAASRLLWGFGWDDWRGNTWSFTVHNWGPLRPEDAPNWNGAEANLGYKLPRLCASWLCAGSAAAVTVPFEGGPYGDFRVTLTFWEKWFVMAGVGHAIPDVYDRPEGSPTWRVVYGFGRRDWRPGTFHLTYHDWGPDEQARNGVLSLGWSWRF